MRIFFEIEVLPAPEGDDKTIQKFLLLNFQILNLR
jgi:hypothetical protein